MTPDAPAVSSTLATLDAAAMQTTSQPRPDGKAVTLALLNAETTAKQQRLTLAPESLYGTWRLCFTAPKKPRLQSDQPSSSGFYVPGIAIAQIGFYPDPAEPGQITIRNQLKTGPLHITFSGPARYPGKKNLLAFDFDRLEVKLFNATLYSGRIPSSGPKGVPFPEASVAKLPFFAFFLATPNYVAARGRGGGLALWIKSQD